MNKIRSFGQRPFLKAVLTSNRGLRSERRIPFEDACFMSQMSQ